jgi:hypothetical protein
MRNENFGEKSSIKFIKEFNRKKGKIFINIKIIEISKK